MRIIFFTHPNFLGWQSMPRYAKLVSEGMIRLGHQVEIWSPEPIFYNSKSPRFFQKWLGYIDQYAIFPLAVKKRLKNYDESTLFVFLDHALGPWVPLVAHKKHIVHCHDFLAQRSSIDEILESTLSYTGKLYQAYIRDGYRKAENFISVSKKTQEDLHKFLDCEPLISEVIYNGLNSIFKPQSETTARESLSNEIHFDLKYGYILHVGGNQWYKNRLGVIEIYNAWRKNYDNSIPLVLIGERPDDALREVYNLSPYKDQILFITGKNDAFVNQAYNGASVLLFPSLAEGFGWPIAEAMEAGCPVITTNESPMTEVGGAAAFYIPRKPYAQNEDLKWALTSAEVLNEVIKMSENERDAIKEACKENVKRFDPDIMIKKIEAIYIDVIKHKP